MNTKSIEEILEDETPIVCPACGYEYGTCDFESEIITMINKNLPFTLCDCEMCPADFWVNKDLTVVLESKCRYCEDTGVVYRDEFSPSGGHYESRHECQECKGRRDE